MFADLSTPGVRNHGQFFCSWILSDLFPPKSQGYVAMARFLDSREQLFFQCLCPAARYLPSFRQESCLNPYTYANVCALRSSPNVRLPMYSQNWLPFNFWFPTWKITSNPLGLDPLLGVALRVGATGTKCKNLISR